MAAESALSTEQMLCHWTEVSFILRAPLEAEGDIAAARSRIDRGLRVITTVQRLAAESGDADLLPGTVFQALLAEKVAADSADANLAYSRQRITNTTAGKVVQGATASLPSDVADLCKLLKLKLEDSKDLEMASVALGDCKQFFDDVQQLASFRGASLAATLAGIAQDS